jgi:hypothetical protein
VPANVRRYINLYQSSNVLGGGDLAPGRGFHGNYASFNLKNRSEVIHVNLDKFPRIQEILASKIRSAGAISEGREPLRLVVPPGSVQNLSHIWSGDGFGLRDLRLIERPHVHVALG